MQTELVTAAHAFIHMLHRHLLKSLWGDIQDLLTAVQGRHLKAKSGSCLVIAVGINQAWLKAMLGVLLLVASWLPVNASLHNGLHGSIGCICWWRQPEE